MTVIKTPGKQSKTNLSGIQTSVLRLCKNVLLARDVEPLSIQLVNIAAQTSDDLLHLSGGDLSSKSALAIANASS